MTTRKKQNLINLIPVSTTFAQSTFFHGKRNKVNKVFGDSCRPRATKVVPSRK
jgi:hypothetical protein